MMNRVEWIAGRRWASDTVFACQQELKLTGGPERILNRLRMGKIQKPHDYAEGVQEIITIVEGAISAKVPGVPA